ncbi:hypothetical protein [Microbispora bryophytorum]|uniref:WxL domain-containing protein n=1 Tax=Microbispora bryophytorum TaxID=1460882 RepID=A0A8H9H566_9ACTN|nr:hypothetical protein [Microbispora bryophytorum]MBD3139184.1 hypothetical protein [Microbispora bryophytorum]TQS03325.1 hypothetical protein FLX07_24335 [Microbispora bryophytorum]GGO15878.1 hypothetical protein GCM10011574_37820 [Microbispora bryophytorum]
MRITRTTQVLAASVLGLALAGLATPALADDPGSGSGIDVSVTIEPTTTPGQISMTVADNDGVSLQENGSDATARQFVGTLPTVTVTDTRRPEDIPAGEFWAVVGQSSQFVAADDPAKTIGPEYLGWKPRLLSESTTGAVAAGEPVSSVIGDGTGAPEVGLESQELLVSTANSADEIGTSQVNADLALRTSTDVAAGEYHSTLTLSLFNQS